MASYTKQERRKKNQKLGQGSNLTIDDLQKNVSVDNMLKSNLGYKKCWRFELSYHSENVFLEKKIHPNFLQPKLDFNILSTLMFFGTSSIVRLQLKNIYFLIKIHTK
jgi:hypothetical protein